MFVRAYEDLGGSINISSPQGGQKNVGDFNLFWIAYFKKKLLTTVLKKPSDLKRIDPNSRMHFINVGVQSFYERSRFLLKFKEYYLFLVKYSAPWAGLSFGFSI